jgi:methylenetetrahydrofolate dehydrogenase (NADP+)/methenyltetrahydrofolate cyclohydrolase
MIIDGRALSKEVLARVTHDLAVLSFSREGRPKLVDVVVGDNPVTESYVGIKQRRAIEVGFDFVAERYPESISQEDLIASIAEIQTDPKLAGLLVQLPLPDHIDKHAAINAIQARFDVDGLTDENIHLLYEGRPRFTPATAGAIMQLIDHCVPEGGLHGMNVVVIGSGDLVGKPVAFLLKERGANVTVVTRATEHIADRCKAAALIVCGAGSPKLLTGDMVSDGAIVIDAGTAESEGGISGDVDFATVEPKAKFITPVPGGVGPMTVAILLKNTLKSVTV